MAVTINRGFEMQDETTDDKRRLKTKREKETTEVQGEVHPQVEGQDQGDTPDPAQDQSDDVEIGQ